MYNVIYINTHDSGRLISPYGYSVKTPNIQKFAEDATLFNQAYSCGPTCSPSRASLLTGTYPHQNGMYGLAQRGFSLKKPENHLANFLSNNGFETTISGIQHEVGWYMDIDNEKLHEIGYENILTNDSSKYKKEEYHIWDYKNAESVIDWLENRDDDRPFLLSYGMHSTHRPFPLFDEKIVDSRYVRPPFPYISNEDTRKDYAEYLMSANNADKCVGLILNKLKELDLYDNSIIIFTTDHGVSYPFHKCNLTDDGIGVSLIIRHPKLGHGLVRDDLLSHIDIFPTICDILEIRKPDYLEGKSFIDIFNKEDEFDREIIFAEVNFHTSYEPIRCARTDRYKYVKYFDDTWNKVNLSNIDESSMKDVLMENGLDKKEKQMEGLYDLYYDPEETNNLINDDNYKEIKAYLKKALKDFMINTKDPLLKGPFEIKPYYKVNKKTAKEASSKDINDYDPRGRRV